MKPATNKDIWTIIIKFFRVSLSSNDADDLRNKKHALLSIALVCPELVDVALDELWRCLTMLEPIVNVLNAHCDTNVLNFQISEGGYWAPLSGKITAGLKSRAAGYLSRIKFLCFSQDLFPREYMLWQVLFSLGLTPVCPNLRVISVSGMDAPSQAYHFAVLATSSLRSITLQADSSRGEIASSLILDSLNYRGTKMMDITYQGHTTTRILSSIFQFSDLHSVAIRAKRYNSSPLTAADTQSFGGMAHLTSLDLSLDMFAEADNVGKWIENMEQLSVLVLHGKWLTTCQCAKNRRFLTVQSLSLILLPSTRNHRQRPPPDSHLSIILKAFPSIHSFRLECESDRTLVEPVISLGDVSVLKERPLRHLEFRHIPVSLSEEDIINVTQTWPTLQRLAIIPGGNVRRPPYSARELLLYASHSAICLHDMSLPLDFSSLTTPHSTFIRSSCKCPLQRLELPRVENLPRDLKGMHTIARNLVSLFPRLRVVTSLDSDLGNLQMIIEFLQDVISSPPSRPDALF